MQLEMNRKKILDFIEHTIVVIGDLLLYVLFFLIAFKVLWGVVALGLWNHVGSEVVGYFLSWPLWARMLIGFPVLVIIFSPVFLIGYWLFDEPRGLNKIIELPKKVSCQGFLEIIRKSCYCLAVFSILRMTWSGYECLGSDFSGWVDLLKRVFFVFIG